MNALNLIADAGLLLWMLIAVLFSGISSAFASSIPSLFYFIVFMVVLLLDHLFVVTLPLLSQVYCFIQSYL